MTFLEGARTTALRRSLTCLRSVQPCCCLCFYLLRSQQRSKQSVVAPTLLCCSTSMQCTLSVNQQTQQSNDLSLSPSSQHICTCKGPWKSILPVSGQHRIRSPSPIGRPTDETHMSTLSEVPEDLGGCFDMLHSLSLQKALSHSLNSWISWCSPGARNRLILRWINTHRHTQT